MIDMRFRPAHLPQMSMPYTIALQRLDDEKVDYDIYDANPDELSASQGIVFSDIISNVKGGNKNPIWVDKDNNVLDGHHRFVKALIDKTPIKTVKINLIGKDAARILNKVQDIYEYEEQHKVEEVVGQDIINANNDEDPNVSYSEFLESLEKHNESFQNDNGVKNQKKIIGYRKDPIKENSVVGNFFTLEPIEGFDKYEIEFDNLLDVDDLGLKSNKKISPIDALVLIWFPHIDFEKISSENNIDSMNLKNKAITEKAKKFGYDGIKYGKKLLQGLK